MSGQFPFGFTPGGSDDPDRPGPGGFDMSQLGAALESLGRMMQAGSSEGAVNWEMATQLARQTVAAEADPTPGTAAREEVAAAVRLAEMWLDERTTFPAATATARAWSRAEWVQATVPAWHGIIDPIAEQVQQTATTMLPGGIGGLTDQGLPPELRAMLPEGIPADLGALAAPLMGMMRQMASAMFSSQAGQGLGSLAKEVLGATDIGIPLTSDGVPTLLPTNVAAFGADLGVQADQVMLFLALRESAHQRLFSHVPWLRSRLQGAVEAYARGISVDADRITDAMTGIDPTRPEALQEVLASGVFEPQDTPEQEAAKARLETLLALVEGWVDAVTMEACGQRLPTAVHLAETMRRRRAAGGPAEKTFATLVGLEMRPRRLREASVFWQEVARRTDEVGRDALWQHPDLLPTAEDLDDVNGFMKRSRIGLPSELTAADEAILSGRDPGEPTDPEADPPQ